MFPSYMLVRVFNCNCLSSADFATITSFSDMFILFLKSRK